MLMADSGNTVFGDVPAQAPVVASRSGSVLALALLAVLTGLTGGCASYGKKIASAQSEIDAERQRVAHNSAEIARLRARVKTQQSKLGFLNSAIGRRDFYDGKCHRVPVEKPALSARPAQSCKTDNETRAHAVNQCVNPGNCEYVGALYALGRLPLEYQYVLNSGCPFKPEDKTFMEEYVGMASVPLCNLTLNAKDDKRKKKRKGKLNKALKFNWSGVVLDLALSLACNVKQDPYRAEYSQVTQCLARESSRCNQRYTQWENQRSRDLFNYQTRQREADRDYANCQRELKKLDYKGGDIRLQIEQAIERDTAEINALQAANSAANQRIATLVQTTGELRAQQADSNKPRRAIAVFH